MRPPTGGAWRTPTSGFGTFFKEGVTSVDVAQNIVVVRTMPGLASAACSALDNMGHIGHGGQPGGG